MAKVDPVAEMVPILQKWQQPTSSELATLDSLTTRSLDAVTHLTEYEDEKANRILTAMAFISAFAGLLFAAVVGHYPPAFLQQLWRASPWCFFLLTLSYGVFTMYGLVLSAGVALSLYGMKPRFNIPKGWKSPGSYPKSFLFFERIIDVPSADWARAFSSTPVEKLEFDYVRNNVLETYLIAEKVPKKLGPLKRASNLYIVSTWILMLWLLVTAITLASIDLFPNPAVLAIKTSDESAQPAKSPAQPTTAMTPIVPATVPTGTGQSKTHQAGPGSTIRPKKQGAQSAPQDPPK